MDSSKVLGKVELSDDVINAFHHIVNREKNINPINVVVARIPDMQRFFNPLEIGHAQVLFRESSGSTNSATEACHWNAIHYDGNVCNVYDSANLRLPERQQTVIDNVIPISTPIIYQSVQRQQNGYDCGVFACAYVTSILFGKNPSIEIYEVNEMRDHLLKILRNEKLEPFPTQMKQDQKNQTKKIETFEYLSQENNKKEFDLINLSNKQIQNEIIQTSLINLIQLKNVEEGRPKENSILPKNQQQRNKTNKQDCSLMTTVNEIKREYNRNYLKEKRNNPLYKEKAQERNTTARKKARKNEKYRKKEQERDTRAHKEIRKNEEYRKKEQEKNTNNHSRKRKNANYRSTESHNKKMRRKFDNENWDNICSEFRNNISEGYINPCYCCGRLWHKKSINKLYKKDIIDIKTIKNPQFFWKSICFLHPNCTEGNFGFTCLLYIRKGDIPKLSMSNGLVFPKIPNILKILTPLEERLLSLRHILMKIVKKGQGLNYQHGLQGNVINV